MKHIFVVFFSICLTSGFSGNMWARVAEETQTTSTDSTIVSWKKFDEKKFNEIVREGDFEYMNEENPPERINFIDIFLAWLNELLAIEEKEKNKNFSLENTEKVIYVVSVLILLMVIAKIFSSEIRSLFYSGGKKIAPQAFWEEKEMPIDILEKELEKALRTEDFKKAISISYILMLKKLAERGYIQWKIDKTNHEYETELKDNSLKNRFRRATYYYEYICYGEFEVEKQLFEKAIEAIRSVITERSEQLSN